MVLTFNRSNLLSGLLLSLKGLRYPNLEIIVVDNNSSDNTSSVAARYPEYTYIKLPDNIGVAARNVGMIQTTGDIIITVDDDITGLSDAHIQNLMKLFSLRPDLGAANFRVVDNQGEISNWVHHCKAEEYQYKEFPTYELTEGAVAFKRNALLAAGLYPESFFLSHEGPDLAFRLLDNGFDVIYTPLVTVTHLHDMSGRASWRRYYFDTRNQFWLVARSFPIFRAVCFLSVHLSAMLVYSVRDGYLTWWCKGVWDGIKGLGTEAKNRKVLNTSTLDVIDRIDRQGPGLFYLLKKRLLKKGVYLIAKRGSQLFTCLYTTILIYKYS